MKLYIEPCDEYPLHELDITDWLAKEKGYDTQVMGTIMITQETSDAYWIFIFDTPERPCHRDWLPKSQCKIVERTGPKQSE
jgi:hypothetical protein